MSSGIALYPALAEQATALALEAQLGLKDHHGALRHSPLALLPWQISRDDFMQAQQVARAIGARLDRLARDNAALAQALGPVLEGRTLQAQLWQALQSVPLAQRRARPLNMTRVDLLQDQARKWKLVEANSIAAGMGPFSEGLAQIQQQLWPELQRLGLATQGRPALAANPVTEALGDTLYQAAVGQLRQHPSTHPHAAAPVVVFVVEPAEDNIFDQRKVARVVEQKGARVVRLTLQEIDALLERSLAPACHLRGIGPVQVLYFRTGYNLADFQDAHGRSERLLRLRAELETLHVTLAPTIGLQLASAKAVQVHWYRQPEADAATEALDTAQFFVADPQVQDVVNWPQWVLKSQGEGGGNVVQDEAIPARIATLSQQERREWLLMRKIPLVPRQSLVPVLRNGAIQFAQQLMSELGLFVLGDDVRIGGYLLRSKPVAALETGVHRGQGMIDTVAFSD
ncbi:MAG: hypothetical protein ACOY7J_09925 [Pseudomonadota bacterium]